MRLFCVPFFLAFGFVGVCVYERDGEGGRREGFVIDCVRAGCCGRFQVWGERSMNGTNWEACFFVSRLLSPLLACLIFVMNTIFSFSLSLRALFLLSGSSSSSIRLSSLSL